MGVYVIPDDQYRKMDGMSQSRLKRLEVSGLEYLKPPPSSSDAFRLGSLIDVMILTPELVKDQFIIPPDFAASRSNVDAKGNPSNSRNTAWAKAAIKDFAKDHAGMTFVSQAEWDTASKLRERCNSKKFMKDFFADKTGRTQVAMDGDINGVLCKGLADGISDNLLFDLKSTRETTMAGFRYTFFKYGYDFQLGFYLRLAWENGFDFPIDNCYIVAASKFEPFDVTVYRIPAIWIEESFSKIDECLEKYKRYREDRHFAVGIDDGETYVNLDGGFEI
jgi:hypothetical protein